MLDFNFIKTKANKLATAIKKDDTQLQTLIKQACAGLKEKDAEKLVKLSQIYLNFYNGIISEDEGRRQVDMIEKNIFSLPKGAK